MRIRLNNYWKWPGGQMLGLSIKLFNVEIFGIGFEYWRTGEPNRRWGFRFNLTALNFLRQSLNHCHNFGPGAITQREDKIHARIVFGCHHCFLQRFPDFARQSI